MSYVKLNLTKLDSALLFSLKPNDKNGYGYDKGFWTREKWINPNSIRQNNR